MLQAVSSTQWLVAEFGNQVVPQTDAGQYSIQANFSIGSRYWLQEVVGVYQKPAPVNPYWFAQVDLWDKSLSGVQELGHPIIGQNNGAPPSDMRLWVDTGSLNAVLAGFTYKLPSSWANLDVQCVEAVVVSMPQQAPVNFSAGSWLLSIRSSSLMVPFLYPPLQPPALDSTGEDSNLRMTFYPSVATYDFGFVITV